MKSRLPPDVLALLESSLSGFEKLELAWHLWRAGAPVPRAELRDALDLDTGSMGALLAELLAAKIIEVGGAPEKAVRLGPRAGGESFKALMALYAEDRLAVVAALSSIAMHRIRTMAARAFAESFVLKAKLRQGREHDTGDEDAPQSSGAMAFLGPALRVK